MRTIQVLSPVVESIEHGFTQARSQAELDQIEFQKELRLISRYLAKGPTSIECFGDEEEALPGLLHLAINAQSEGASAIVIDCMLDPGLFEIRKHVRIPVFGPLQTALTFAHMHGKKAAMLDICDTDDFRTLATRYGMSNVLVSVQSIMVPVLELSRQPETVLNLLEAAAFRAIDEGAEVLILGCTALGPYRFRLAALLENAGCKVAVVDALELTFEVAYATISVWN